MYHLVSFCRASVWLKVEVRNISYYVIIGFNKYIIFKYGHSTVQLFKSQVHIVLICNANFVSCYHMLKNRTVY